MQDSTLNAIDLECVLEDLGHCVTEVAITPEAALSRLETVSGRIDAVVFDAMQMGLPTYSFAREAAKLDVASVVTSDYPETFVRVLGFDQPYLGKPFRREDVRVLVNTLAPRRAETAAA